MRVSNYWQNFNFWVNYHFNVYTYTNPKPTPYSNANTVIIVVQREKTNAVLMCACPVSPGRTIWPKYQDIYYVIMSRWLYIIITEVLWLQASGDQEGDQDQTEEMIDSSGEPLIVFTPQLCTWAPVMSADRCDCVCMQRMRKMSLRYHQVRGSRGCQSWASEKRLHPSQRAAPSSSSATPTRRSYKSLKG